MILELIERLYEKQKGGRLDDEEVIFLYQLKELIEEMSVSEGLDELYGDVELLLLRNMLTVRKYFPHDPRALYQTNYYKDLYN